MYQRHQIISCKHCSTICKRCEKHRYRVYSLKYFLYNIHLFHIDVIACSNLMMLYLLQSQYLTLMLYFALNCREQKIVHKSKRIFVCKRGFCSFLPFLLLVIMVRREESLSREVWVLFKLLYENYEGSKTGIRNRHLMVRPHFWTLSFSWTVSWRLTTVLQLYRWLLSHFISLNPLLCLSWFHSFFHKRSKPLLSYEISLNVWQWQC